MKIFNSLLDYLSIIISWGDEKIIKQNKQNYFY